MLLIKIDGSNPTLLNAKVMLEVGLLLFLLSPILKRLDQDVDQLYVEHLPAKRALLYMNQVELGLEMRHALKVCYVSLGQQTCGTEI